MHTQTGEPALGDQLSSLTTLPVRRRASARLAPGISIHPARVPVAVGQTARPLDWARVRSAIRAITGQTGVMLALISFWVNILWVAAVPSLKAPDEPSHLLAVVEVRKLSRLPELHYSNANNPAGEIVNTYVDPETVAYARSVREFGWDYLLQPYESKQPPLYYLAAGIASQVVPPDPRNILYISRIVSALFGAATVFLVWATARQMAPGNRALAVAAAGFVALLPQFTFDSAMVSNDSAINFASALAIYVLVRGLCQPRFDRWMFWAGAAIGLAVLSKLWAVALVPGAVLAWIFRLFQVMPGPAVWRDRVWRGARMAAGATVGLLAVCGWWIVRNLIVYGDPTGTSEALSYDRKFRLLNLSSPEMVEEFVQSTWTSFWGRFGWMDVALQNDFYEQARFVTTALLLLSLAAGLLFVARWLVHRVPVPRHAWQGVLVMGVILAANFVAYLQFSIQVAFQGQSRYLFPAIVPLALLFVGGASVLARGRAGRLIWLGLPILWLAYMNIAGLILVHSVP